MNYSDLLYNSSNFIKSTLNDVIPKICVVIQGPSLQEVYNQLMQAEQWAHLLEWRLDYFEELEEETLQSLRQNCSLPIILTLRSQAHGGRYQGSEKDRLAQIQKLMKLQPDFIDLEYQTCSACVQLLRREYPNVQIILSYHNFEKTPEDLDAILTLLQRTPADVYKIAVTAKNSSDALRFLNFLRLTSQQVIGISMGEHGQVSRFVGPLLSRLWTYASVEGLSPTAPGMLSAQTLVNIYYYQTFIPQTALYGLIGDPIDKSIGHLTHNQVMQHLHLQAMYVKMCVSQTELASFISLAKAIGFKGLSVTMPLKEAIFSHVDEVDTAVQHIGAINTLAFEDGKVIGYNTDGKGALDAIEEKKAVKKCKIVVIGAGGAAKAIAYEALQRGGEVTILNRCAERADQLAQRFGCRSGDLSQIQKEYQEGYDILINCTSEQIPIDPFYINSNALVMDLAIKPLDAPLLDIAQKIGCQVVYGYEMFLYQAIGQFEIWFKNLMDKEQLAHSLRTAVKKSVFINN